MLQRDVSVSVDLSFLGGVDVFGEVRGLGLAPFVQKSAEIDIDSLVAPYLFGIELGEAIPDVRQIHAILWSPRSRKTRLDRREVQLERFAEFWVRRFIRTEHPLFFGVSLDEIDLVPGAARETEIVERLVIDRVEGCRRAELGRHVGERGAVCD